MLAFRLFARLTAYYLAVTFVVLVALQLFPNLREYMPFGGVEVGWRLARPAWGHGYATEAALAAAGYGFAVMGLPEIFAVTTAGNLRSQAVMRRIGMTSDPAEDFDDPDVDEGPLRRYVVYRKPRDPER